MEMSILLEQFNLDPLSNFKDLDPFDYFKEDGNTEFQQYYQEVTTGTTKKNVFQKLWNFILKVLKLLSRQITRLINWIKRLFSNKRNIKTADQIISDSVSLSDELFDSDGFSNSKFVKLHIPSHMNSEIELEDIHLMAKDFILKFTNDGNFTIDAWDIDNRIQFYTNVKPNASQGPIKGKHKGGKRPLINLLVLLNKPEIFNKLKNAVSVIYSNDRSKILSAWDDFNDDFQNSWDFSKQEYSLDQCIEFQKSLNELIAEFEKFHDIDNTNINNDVVFTLNKISDFLSDLQMQMNALTSAFTNAYIVDKKYYGSIKNIDELSQFVNKCIDAGIPHKYLAYNIYIVSSNKLKGYGSNGDENNPVWGQSRVVLYPSSDKNIVYKIALSKWGIASNKIEFDISKKLESVPDGGSVIAFTNSITQNNVISTMERVDLLSKNKISDSDLDKLKSKLNSICKDNNIKLDLTQDIHRGNVALKNRKLVCIDYAFVSRI